MKIKKLLKGIVIGFAVCTVVFGFSELLGVIKETAVGKVVSEILTMKDGFDDDPDESEIVGDERGYLPGETKDTINFQYSTDVPKNEYVEPFDPSGYYSTNTFYEVYIEHNDNDLISSKITENQYVISIYNKDGSLQSQMVVDWDHSSNTYCVETEETTFVLSELTDSDYKYKLTVNEIPMYLSTYTGIYDRSLTGYEDLGGGYNGYRDYDGQDMFVSITECSDAYTDATQYIVSVYDRDDNEFVYVIHWDEDSEMYICNDHVYLCASDDLYYDYKIVDSGVDIYLKER